MRMGTRVKSLLAAAVVSAFGFVGLNANAAIQVNMTTTSITSGSLAGFDVVRFYGGFDSADLLGVPPTDTQGNPTPDSDKPHGLQSAKVTLTSSANFKFAVGQFFPPNNGASNPDYDIYGANSDDPTLRSGTEIATSSDLGLTTEIFLRATDPSVAPFSVQGLQVNGVPLSSTANQSTATYNPGTIFANAKSMRVEGILKNDPPGTLGADTSAKTDGFTNAPGQGALFAVAIVPHGSVVNAVGQLSPDKGALANFDTNAPEPATFGLLSVGAIGVLARRRRKA